MTYTFHAVPYYRLNESCICTRQKCGGIRPQDECPEHGFSINPAMLWHREENETCERMQRSNPPSQKGH